MAVDFKEADARIVNELQAQLTQVLLRAAEQKVEAALAVFACIRCARVLLERYPPDTRAALLTAIDPFLRGELALVEDEKQNRIILPPGVRG
jgi:hypothetical protein